MKKFSSGGKSMAKDRNAKKKMAAVSIATVASLGVLLSNTFDNPKDLVGNHIVNEDRRDLTKIDYDKSRTPDSKLAWLEKVPVSIRACIGVPLWAIGNAVIAVLSPLWTIAGAPLLQFVISWLVTAAVALAVITIAAKILFPNLPLKKLVNKKTILYSLIGTLILAILDKVLGRFWKGYRSFKYVMRFAGGLAIITIAMVPFIRKKVEELRKPQIIYDEV